MKRSEDLKEGDTVWTIQDGKVTILSTTEGDYYPIKTSTGGKYTKDGKYQTWDEYPSIYLTDPLDKKLNGMWMLVSDDNISFVRRFVIAKKQNKFIAWCLATTCEMVIDVVATKVWNYAKEEKEICLTMDEIADKFGINVDKLKIKK
jgi:hypothetical protein